MKSLVSTIDLFMVTGLLLTTTGTELTNYLLMVVIMNLMGIMQLIADSHRKEGKR